jgi:[FeFe] hydrogenase H-cluster maturation GTPase HydF
MTTVPRGERLIIVLTGKRNAGKSSLINALTGQEIAIVSDTPGTTTDPVDKHYELLPLGPVTFYDTAGIDDIGELGQKRIQATKRVLQRADIAILVVGESDFDQSELKLLEQLSGYKIPLLVVFNKSDLHPVSPQAIDFCNKQGLLYSIVSAETAEGIIPCKDKLISLAPLSMRQERPLAGDLVQGGDHVILVTPIDLAAPKGRLILPQVQVIRDLLDNDIVVTVVKERELEYALESLRRPPALVITDSQVVLKVAGDVPEEVPLTTFSILFARYKGELNTLLQGARQIDLLKNGDKIMIAESCSHHVQCDDIGRVKIPRWLNQYTGLELNYEIFAGHDFPDNLEEFALAIHCGACMINPMAMRHRMLECERRGVSITNYGMAISQVQGLLERVVRVFAL